MKNKRKISVYGTVFFCICAVLFLCGCTRRAEGADGLDEIFLAGADEASGQGKLPEGNGQEAEDVSGSISASDQNAQLEEDATDQSPGRSPSGSYNMTEVSEKHDCYVYICGAVRKPGVYRMEQDERIYAVIERAGGFAEEACEEYVNQALRVVDGLKIWIPTVEEAKETEAAGSAGAGNDGLVYPAGGGYPEQEGDSRAQMQREDGLVNINTAGEEQLCTLTGIGKAKAQAIIAYRGEHGNFIRPEDIMKVAGIKQSGYDKIREQISVD